MQDCIELVKIKPQLRTVDHVDIADSQLEYRAKASRYSRVVVTCVHKFE